MALLVVLALWPRVSTLRFQLSLAGRDPPDARTAAQRIVQAVREVRVPGLPPVTVSAGLALACGVRSVPERRTLTDGRLYAARAAGRDRLMAGTRPAGRRPTRSS